MKRTKPQTSMCVVCPIMIFSPARWGVGPVLSLLAVVASFQAAAQRAFEAEERLPLGHEWVNVAAESNGGEAVSSEGGSSKGAHVSPGAAWLARAPIDGGRGIVWSTKGPAKSLEVRFVRNYPISRITIHPAYSTTSGGFGKAYQVQYREKDIWKDFAADAIERAGNSSSFTLTFKPVETDRVRFLTRGKGVYGLTKIEAWASIPGAVKLTDGRVFTEREMSLLSHALSGQKLVLERGWRVKTGDNTGYTGPAFDDKDWRRVENSMRLVQGKDGDWVWYRVDFALPAQWEEKQHVLLDLGQVSSFEEVYLNGKKAVTFGDPEALFTIAGGGIAGLGPEANKYNLHQRLPLPAGLLKSGRNVLAIRVKVTGSCFFGHYGGWPSLQEYQPVFARFVLKGGGADGIKTLLTTVEHLNRYSPGEEIVVKPELFSFDGEPYAGEMRLDVSNDRQQKVLATQVPAKACDRAGNTEKLIRFAAPVATGTYHTDLKFVAAERTLWQRSVEFTVRDRPTYAMPADPAINQIPDKEFTVEVSKDVVGGYGPSSTDFKGEALREQMPDARGGLVCSARFDRQSPPLLFSAQVRATPANPVPRPAPLAAHDGWEDAWIYGYVTPGGKRDKFDVKLTRANWSGRSYTYTYPDGIDMEFAITNVSPAYRVKTNARQLKVFDRLGDFGLGLPVIIAYETKAGVKIVPTEAGVDGREMSANWMLVSFSGAKGWDEFDVPFLFVLEKRPNSVRNGEGALSLSFPEATGTVQCMPLYGVTLLSPDMTAGWQKALPREVVERCRLWSRVLSAPPVEVVRSAMIDYGRDQVVLRDRFEHLELKDDWGTVPLRLSLVPPSLVLAQSAGNIAMTTGVPAQDLHYASLHGPLLAAEDSDEQRIRIDGLLHLVREVRIVKQASTPQANEVRARLNRAVAKAWQDGPRSFLDRPTYGFITGQHLHVGNAEPVFTNTLRALPMIEQPLRDEITEGLKNDLRKYLFYADKPEEAWKTRMVHPNLPQLFHTRTPQTGLPLCFSPSYSCGGDVACWEAVRVYMAWRYAWALDEWNFVERHYGLLKEIYNSVRNTHDWQISATWDDFSGVRIGNGLQETSIMHGGATGMARLAKKYGDQTTFEWASYHAVMQVVGLQSQLATSEFRRAFRPWSGSHSNARRYEEQETLLPRYYAEQNAYAGFSYSTIGSKLNVTGGDRSYCMTQVPEMMRPYELWRDYGDEFFNHPKVYEFVRTRPIYWTGFDTLFYLTSFAATKSAPPPYTWEEFVKTRLNTASGAWRWEYLADFCGILDSLGEVTYARLW